MKKRYNVLNSASSPRGMALRRVARAPSRSFRLGDLAIRPGKNYPVNVDILRKHKRELLAAVSVGTLEVREGLRRLPMDELKELLAMPQEEVVEAAVGGTPATASSGESDSPPGDDETGDPDDDETKDGEGESDEGGEEKPPEEVKPEGDPEPETTEETKAETEEKVETGRKTLPEGWESFNKTELVSLAKELGMDPGDDTKKVLLEKIKQYAAS